MKRKDSKTKQFNRDTATLFQMFDYFCGRINFAQSPLDADGVYCMNELFMRLRKLSSKEEYNPSGIKEDTHINKFRKL